MNVESRQTGLSTEQKDTDKTTVKLDLDDMEFDPRGADNLTTVELEISLSKYIRLMKQVSKMVETIRQTLESRCVKLPK